MSNRLLKYNSKEDYESDKDSLIIPYVATYPSGDEGKSVVIYANADGENLSEVIATANLTLMIEKMAKDIIQLLELVAINALDKYTKEEYDLLKQSNLLLHKFYCVYVKNRLTYIYIYKTLIAKRGENASGGVFPIVFPIIFT